MRLVEALGPGCARCEKSTARFGLGWGGAPLEALAAILFGVLVVVWIVVAARTLAAVRSGAVWGR